MEERCSVIPVRQHPPIQVERYVVWSGVVVGVLTYCCDACYHYSHYSHYFHYYDYFYYYYHHYFYHNNYCCCYT